MCSRSGSKLNVSLNKSVVLRCGELVDKFSRDL